MTMDVEKIRAAATAQIEGDPEAGASLCVILDGEEIIYEQWGLADARSGVAYTPATLQISMSMAKGVCAALLAVLIDRGKIDLEERVARFWPEFAANGKGDVTVAQLLSHQAGLPTLDGGYTTETVADRAQLAEKLAGKQPMWPPATAFGYHPFTFGNYADILFERAAGSTVADLLAEVSDLIDGEIYDGLPLEHRDRAARMLMPIGSVRGLPAELRAAIEADPEGIMALLMNNTPEVMEDAEAFYNGDAIKSVSMPAANMFTNTRSLARLYSALAAGGNWQGRHLCSPDSISLVATERVRGLDFYGGSDMAFGVGFQKPTDRWRFSPNDRAFGHGGAGGSFAFADPDAKLALAWMPTRMRYENLDTRLEAIVGSIYAQM